ncbi:two-component regulator propeller domain-containing protein [Parapedobacter sp. 2B3]|uniref:ligand-binding sensor domain-containing protein n=1 Tax=Parapedobacter sp. 2B3 TaxID=3342381 RepID=UPI0035B6528A
MHVLKICVFPVLLLFVRGHLLATESTASPDSLTVMHIAQEEGLSQLGALAMDFDRNGYLWVGTENGLNRFNGYQMQVYKVNDKPGGLPDDHIRSMYYANDTLWLATNTHSVVAYLMAQDRFIDFREQMDTDQHSFVKFSSVLYPAPGNLLIAGTIGNCLIIDRNTLKIAVLPIPGAANNEVISMIDFDDGQYLVGTNAGGVYQLDIRHRSIQLLPALTSLKNTLVNAFFKLAPDRILIGADDGLYEYNPRKGHYRKIDDKGVKSLNRWDDHTLIVGGFNETHFVRNGNEWQKVDFFDDDGGELQATIVNIKRDPLGGMWLGTAGRGVFYYHPHQRKFVPSRITVANSPKKDFISIFHFLRDGNDLWMATDIGFVRHDLEKGDYKLYRTDLLEYALAKDANQTIWAGGFGQGLLKYNRKEDRFDTIPLPFADKDIIQLTPVSPDTIWVHTWSSGIYALNVHDYGITPRDIHGQQLVRSRTSFIDSSGAVWIGSDEGLYRIRGNQSDYYDSLSNERVFAITEDPAHNIWVGTAKGLNCIDTQTGHITAYTQQAGLPNDFIYSVASDRRGNIWVSTNFGIAVLDHAHRTFKNYTEDDGLQNNEFNGKAGYADSLGYFYFGGMNGFNIFHPDSVYVNQQVGKTLIEDVQLFGMSLQKNIPYTDTLVFSYNENVITFDFASLNYLWAKKNRYQFMLKGFDKTWRPITQNRSTTYTNLDPGTYTFTVMGSNNELIWGDTDTITIIIQSPWYASTGFRLAASALLALAITGTFVYKNYQQKKINFRLSTMVSERTEELRQTNSALNASLETTQQQKENIGFLMQELNHRVKNNLQLITSLIDIQSFEIEDADIQDKLRILQSRVFTVSKIHDILNQKDAGNNIRTDRFICDLAKDLVVFSGLSIGLEVDVEPIYFPVNKLTHLGLILNELVTNSIKHAFEGHQGTKRIQISLQEESDCLKFIYRDNGKGFNITDLNPGTKKGVNLIKNLARELKGTIELRNQSGAVFICHLPKTNVV